MKLLRSIFENAYGLLVDDGWIASGTLLALAVVGLWSLFSGSNQDMRDLGGPMLFVLLMLILVLNLYSTAVRTRDQ